MPAPLSSSPGGPVVSGKGAIGIFGGTFDPIHRGHLLACRTALEGLPLDQVRVLPAGDPPLHAQPGASGAHRLAMARLAVAGQRQMVVDDRELRRPGRSFMVDTLASLRSDFPGAPLVLLLGRDAFVGLVDWYRWQALFDLAHIVVWTRPGSATTLRPELVAAVGPRTVASGAQLVAGRASGHVLFLEQAAMAVSATEVRRRLAVAEPVADLLAPEVCAYIMQQRLYRASE